MTALRMERLSVVLDGRPVLREVSLTVEPGRWLGLIGPNGAGKSTLLSAVIGLVDFTGTVELSGTDTRELHRRSHARHVAYVPQDPVTPVGVTVFDYVLLGRLPHLGYFARPTDNDHRVTTEVLRRLTIDSLAERELGTLSGGERQRVVLARALAQRAPLLVLDEPTSALDLGRQQQVLELLDEIRQDQEITLLTAMHDVTLAAQYANELALLSDGNLIAHGPAGVVVTAERIREHYDATANVTNDEAGRPLVQLRRPRTAPTTSTSIPDRATET